MGRKNVEFPKLTALNLYSAPITGNGNCLFNALSDQLHGDQSRNIEFRATTTDYMRSHKEDFLSFIAVHPGGGTRRSKRIPKRKNVGADTKCTDKSYPTADELETTFQKHLTEMTKGGSYGGNMEIRAFANAYKVNVCIYSEAISNFLEIKCLNAPNEGVRTAYIVHHDYEHFTSIRNISGPHRGLPCVVFKLPEDPYARPWMVEAIMTGLPYLAPRESVIQALHEYKGNISNALSSLMPSSSQNSSRTSSIERDPLSDDDDDQKPKKKADRRPSRPHPLQLGNSNKDFTNSATDPSSVSPDPSQLSAALSKLSKEKRVDPDETEEEDWQNEGSSGKDLETTSVNTSASDSSVATGGNTGKIIRIKLSQPKKPAEKKSASSREPSNTSEYDADGEKPQRSRVIAKPRRRLITGAERDRLEKAKRVVRRASLSPTSANPKYSTHIAPVLDDGIKILSI